LPAVRVFSCARYAFSRRASVWLSSKRNLFTGTPAVAGKSGLLLQMLRALSEGRILTECNITCPLSRS
jgi:hypothetical protein